MQWIAYLVGHEPSTQPAVVVDALEHTQVQADDTQIDDDKLQETGVGATSNLDNSDTAVPSPASTDVTDTSGKIATISQEQMKYVY